MESLDTGRAPDWSCHLGLLDVGRAFVMLVSLLVLPVLFFLMNFRWFSHCDEDSTGLS